MNDTVNPNVLPGTLPADAGLEIPAEFKRQDDKKQEATVQTKEDKDGVDTRVM